MACSNDQCEGDPTPYRLSSGGWSHDPTDTGDDVVCPGPAEPLADAAITRGRDTHTCCETSVSDSSRSSTVFAVDFKPSSMTLPSICHRAVMKWLRAEQLLIRFVVVGAGDVYGE